MVTATDPAPPPPQSAARARASKTEILRVSRGRLREPREPPPAQAAIIGYAFCDPGECLVRIPVFH